MYTHIRFPTAESRLLRFCAYIYIHAGHSETQLPIRVVVVRFPGSLGARAVSRSTASPAEMLRASEDVEKSRCVRMEFGCGCEVGSFFFAFCVWILRFKCFRVRRFFFTLLGSCISG